MSLSRSLALSFLFARMGAWEGVASWVFDTDVTLLDPSTELLFAGSASPETSPWFLESVCAAVIAHHAWGMTLLCCGTSLSWPVGPNKVLFPAEMSFWEYCSDAF